MARKKSIPGYTQCIEAAFTLLNSSKKPMSEARFKADVLKNLNCHDLGEAEKDVLEYRLGCALAFLRTREVAERSDEGLWNIAPQYAKINALDVEEAEDIYRMRMSYLHEGKGGLKTLSWERKLYTVIQKLPARQFVSVMELLLKTEGFSDIKVLSVADNGDCYGTAIAPADRTKRSAFCCKRFLPTVEPEDIREFRGYFKTNVKRGLYVALGVFTEDAIEEASDPDKVPLQLIDGLELVNRMVSEGIGVKEFKDYQIDAEFFEGL